MTDPTRRKLLTGCGAGLAALAGCSGLSEFGDETDERPDYDREAVERAVASVEDVLEPDAFPVGIPAALQHHHRDRAREYVDAVPDEPGYPNGVIASQVAEDREAAASALNEDASGRPRSRLETWRNRREEAATVMGTHLAATGEIGRSDVRALRERARSRLAAFEADWAYRATDPVEAVVVHATLEDYVQTCRRQLHTRAPFPADPGKSVFQAGDVVGTVDGAMAVAIDAVRLREQYRSGVDDDVRHRQHLAGAAARLGRSLSRTASDLEEYVDVEPDEVFDGDLSDTPAETLFRDTSRTVEWRSEQAEAARQRHDPATAVLAAGHGFVAAGALEAVVDAIEGGHYREYPSVDDIEAAVDGARGALEAAWDVEPQALAVDIAEPALLSLRGAAVHVREHYGGPEQAFVQALHAEAQARAVPAATAFVAERLQATGPD
ncbi:hypothetical protein SAMN05216559_2082 [Halomicrobium zhouii]|uniref:Uncharacterized protein n=1 Tax=Halomicrobium zhouii TaxID=767519 RepID=A0A1I6L5H9_9EURY|nr:hypothetical protein [Halomicrobium zhouii]SFR98696.1 hypothetical protein SAMN05216559_2082 [Halomicrobium zhouii]